MNTERYDLIDVSHPIEDGMVTYPGLPGPVIVDFLSREESRSYYAPGTEFHIGRIDMVANTGTYIDAPFHRYADGAALAEFPLSKLANLPGIVVRTRARSASAGRSRAIEVDAFKDIPLAGRAVLIDTGWSQHWNTEQYYVGHPFLTEEASLYLRDMGAALVGIDSLNIDDTSDGQRPAHSVLLAAEIPIVEHLTGLDRLPDDGFRFFAAPIAVEHMGSFPVRAFGLVIGATSSGI